MAVTVLYSPGPFFLLYHAVHPLDQTLRFRLSAAYRLKSRTIESFTTTDLPR
jgi:hypothetical protein